VSQAKHQFGRRCAGACRRQLLITRRHYEDQDREEGHQRQAAGILLVVCRRAADEQKITMAEACGAHRGRQFLRLATRSVAFSAIVAALGCSAGEVSRSEGTAAVLRVGVPGLSSSNAGNGLKQLAQILSVEGLARLGEDGRPEPALAE